MKRCLCFTVVFLILISVLPTFATNVFTDVDSGHYSYEAVKNVKELGIINGYTDGSFKPDNPITRAEIAAIMCQMAKEKPSNGAESVFSDVPENHWASGYISKAAEKKIIVGSNGIFRPDDNVTYEEAIKMTIMATGFGENITPYPSDWSKAYLEIAESTHISSGLKGKKGENATRADVAVMVNNALGITSDGGLILYSKPLYNSNQNMPLNISFALNEDVFFMENTTYNKELAKASLLLSMTSYDYITTEKPTHKNAGEILSDMGYSSVVSCDLENEYTDSHITSFYMGKKSIEKDGEKIEVIAVAVRGTNGTLKEWTSNFDIGSGLEDEEYVKDNHKGYDITSSRIIKKIDEYIESSTSADTKKTIWITGHSRGGSIANICSAKLADKGLKCYAYTFGASRTTVSTNYADYGFIFNIVNNDDLVTYLPMKQWGFNSYGKTAGISVSEKLLSQWTETTGLKKYICKSNISSMVDSIASCATDRKSCYAYREDGKVRIGLKNEAQGAEYTTSLKNSFAAASIPYCSFETVKSSESPEYPYVLEIDMQPAFLMHNIAAVLSGKLSVLTFLTLPVSDYLVPTHSAVISAYMGGIVHPHTPETYYVITNSLSDSDFK